MNYPFAALFSSACLCIAPAFAADFRITDFGAVPDGSQSAAAALDAALAAAGTDATSRVVFPAGTYLVDRTIRVPAGRHFRMVGEGSVTIRTGPDLERLGGYHGGQLHRTVFDIGGSATSDNHPFPLRLTLENLGFEPAAAPVPGQKSALLRARCYIGELRIEGCRFEGYTHVGTFGRLHLTEGVHPGSDAHTMIGKAVIAGNRVVSDGQATGQNPKSFHLYCPGEALIEENRLYGKGDGYVFRIDGGGFDTIPVVSRGATHIVFRRNYVESEASRAEYCQIAKATDISIHDNEAVATRPGVHNFMDLFNCMDVRFHHNKARGGGLCFFGHADLNNGEYKKALVGSRGFHAWDNEIVDPTHSCVFNIGGDGTVGGNRATRDVLIERTTVRVTPGFDASRVAFIYSFVSNKIELRDNRVEGIGRFVRTYYDRGYNIHDNTIKDVPELVNFAKTPGEDGQTRRSHVVGENRLVGTSGSMSTFSTLTGAP